MESEWLIVIILLIIATWLVWMRKTQCVEPEEAEEFSTGFSVTSGLTYYNQGRRCRAMRDVYGSSTPYCESIGTVIH